MNQNALQNGINQFLQWIYSQIKMSAQGDGLNWIYVNSLNKPGKFFNYKLTNNKVIPTIYTPF